MAFLKLRKQVGLLAISFGLGFAILAAPPASSKTYSSVELSTIASRIIADNADVWQLNPKQLKLNRVFDANDGLVTVRYRQFINDVPVINSYVSLTLREDGTFISKLSQVSTISRLPNRTGNFGLAGIMKDPSIAHTLSGNFESADLGSAQLLLLIRN